MNVHVLTLAKKELGVDEGSLVARPIANDFFERWSFWHVRDKRIPPRFVKIAADSNGARKITLEGGLAEIVASEPVLLASRERAVAYVKFFLSLAMPMADIINEPAEIQGISREDAQKLQGKVFAPAVEPDREGQKVTLNLWQEGTVYRGEFTINTVGAITVRTRTIAEHVGVTITME